MVVLASYETVYFKTWTECLGAYLWLKSAALL